MSSSAKSAARGSTAEVVDIASRPVAVVYAKALLGAAQREGGANSALTEQLLEELESLQQDVLEAYPKFAAMLSSAMLSAEEKIGILQRTIGRQASPLAMRFLKVLANNGRLGALAEIIRTARQQYDAQRGLHRVEVVTAAPLDGAQAESIRNKLRAMLGGEPLLVERVDPELVGGVVLRVGDTVYDGSVAARLERVRRQMITRSVHEIQSRRDRFSHTTGN